MNLNLAFASSISSQIGLYSIPKNEFSKINYIFIFPPYEYKKKKNLINIFSSLGVNNIIIIKSIIFKILIFLLIDLLIICSNFNLINLTLISPRPLWLVSVLGSNRFVNKINLSKFFNLKKKYYEIFYGDGLSCFCYESKPFWLFAKNNKISNSIIKSYNQRFYFTYHMFESESIFLNYAKTRNIIFEKINVAHLISKIKSASNFLMYINEFTDELKKIKKYNKSSSLKIFTTTTFSKTNRCSVKSEIDLYKRYFSSKICDDESYLIFKLHPAAGYKINSDLNKANNEKYKDRALFSFNSFNAIPIEMILYVLINEKIFDENKIELYACSSGTAFPKFLFNKINIIISFGENEITKVLKNDFVSGRLQQERILIKKFN